MRCLVCVCFSKIKLCAKMMFSLLLRLMRMLTNFVPWCTGRLHQMGLIVVTIKLFLLVLQQPILIGWDWNVAFNLLFCDQNYFLIVWSSGMIICLMWHVCDMSWHVVMFRWLADILWQSHSLLGSRFGFVFTFWVCIRDSWYDWTWHDVGWRHGKLFCFLTWITLTCD